MEDGLVILCELDIYGFIFMFILRELFGGKVFYLGDFVYVNEDFNLVVFWYCGVGVYFFVNLVIGVIVGVYLNWKIGFVMDFGLKVGKVIIFRVSYILEGYCFLVFRGEVLDVE